MLFYNINLNFAVRGVTETPINLKLHELSHCRLRRKRANQKINIYDHLLQSSLALQEFGMFMGNKIMINIQIAKVRQRTVT